MPNAYDKLENRLKGDGEPQQPKGRGYITHDAGYVPHPSSDSLKGAYEPASAARSYSPTDDRNHPLHRIYRRRIRGIRVRWLGSGFLLGALAGILVTLLVSAAVVTTFPSVLYNFTGDPDLAIVIGENYLNREVTDRLATGAYQAGPFQLTGLTLDLKSGNRMDLHPAFSADLLLTKLNINASVTNQLSVKDGKLVITMTGDPQLGNLNVPLDMLPFNLKDSVTQAVNQINNDMLAAEINKSVQNAAAGQDFVVDGVTSTDNNLTIRLNRSKP